MKNRLNWLWYWHVARRARNWPHFVARHLPRKVLYWAVVVAAVETEKNGDPSEVTAVQMLKKLEVAA